MTAALTPDQQRTAITHAEFQIAAVLLALEKVTDRAVGYVDVEISLRHKRFEPISVAIILRKSI